MDDMENYRVASMKTKKSISMQDLIDTPFVLKLKVLFFFYLRRFYTAFIEDSFHDHFQVSESKNLMSDDDLLFCLNNS